MTKLRASFSWSSIVDHIRYFGIYPADVTVESVKAAFNPYRYGHITEVSIDIDGNANPVKWYTLGRAAFEMG